MVMSDFDVFFFKETSLFFCDINMDQICSQCSYNFALINFLLAFMFSPKLFLL